MSAAGWSAVRIPSRTGARNGDPDNPGAPEPPAADAANAAECLEALRNDPSLRYSETGRALLRLLINTIGLDRPEPLVTGLPAYSRAAAATVARACADRWLRIAAELDARSYPAAPSAPGMASKKETA